ncbi:MAG: efflux RND transporter periplasmic adaptor subunit [Candidatus Acidiferrales bacterium]
MKRNWKRLFTAGLAVMLAVILARLIVPNRKAAADQDDDDDAEQAIKPPSRVSIQNGQTILTLDARTQSQAGVTVAPLKEITSRGEMTAPAIVLSAQGLVSARESYTTEQMNLEKAQVSVHVDQEEYDRLKQLYEGRQNASRKSVQAAWGILRSDQADVEGAQQTLALQADAVRQTWGGVIAIWVAGNPASLNRVFNQSEFLVQVTLPAGAESRPPARITLEIAGSTQIEARLISPFPQVDPRVQGMGLLYVVRNYSGLAPGLNLLAHIPTGRQMRGVMIPESAIVWWQGNAWVYQQTAPGRFARRLVPTNTPLENGIFVSSGFSPGNEIVVRGAQALLSEEFRSQIQPED